MHSAGAVWPSSVSTMMKSIMFLEDKRILMFDPYYEPEPFKEYPDIEVDQDHPFSYNRKVPEAYFNKENLSFYAFGPYELREAVLLFNERTALTSEHTIEYFI